ncbi:Os03g0128900, partial [Oryza sativa Japonica Group]
FFTSYLVYIYCFVELFYLGAIMYIKNEFNLQNDPMMEGLILAMSLIGATIITALSGMITNSIGKRPLLSVAAILYSISALIMFQASNEYMLLLARLIYGFGSGLVVTYAPLYISETAPTNMRGLLNTLPQFNGSLGMLLSYIMVFLMSLTLNPNWRIMLGSLSIPSFVFLLLCIFYLPESPVFLVSKGKIEEAKNVMKRLRGTNEVSSMYKN